MAFRPGRTKVYRTSLRVSHGREFLPTVIPCNGLPHPLDGREGHPGLVEVDDVARDRYRPRWEGLDAVHVAALAEAPRQSPVASSASLRSRGGNACAAGEAPNTGPRVGLLIRRSDATQTRAGSRRAARRSRHRRVKRPYAVNRARPSRVNPLTCSRDFGAISTTLSRRTAPMGRAASTVPPFDPIFPLFEQRQARSRPHGKNGRSCSPG